MGAIGLGAMAPQLCGAEVATHFAPRAKRVIHLFMNGGPTLLLIGGAVLCQKPGVVQAAFEFRCEVHVVVFRQFADCE